MEILTYSLFTRSPKDLREVYIPSADPLERENSQKGTKLKIPLSQLEERFRGVYSNGERNNLDITINALDNEDMKQWEKKGIKQLKTYNFHEEDGLKSPQLVDTVKKEPIWEKL